MIIVVTIHSFIFSFIQQNMFIFRAPNTVPSCEKVHENGKTPLGLLCLHSDGRQTISNKYAVRVFSVMCDCDPVDCGIDPMDGKIFLDKTRILEWVAIPQPGDLPDSRMELAVSVSCTAGGFFY